MVLTAAQITSNNIVQNAGNGYRATTYDATVGAIFQAGVEISTGSFVVPPRGVVWVVSKEEFHLPETVTGLATLKTRWTHRGMLALNVGIVDPCYKGALATALVNFSESDFEVKVGEPFFRILFFEHGKTGAAQSGEPLAEYKRRVLDYSRSYQKTFLNLEAVASQVAERVFGLPKWATNLGIVALLVALLAIFVPIAFSVYSDYRLVPARVEALQKQVDDLKAAGDDGARILAAERRIDELTKAKPQERVIVRTRPAPPPAQGTTVVINH